MLKLLFVRRDETNEAELVVKAEYYSGVQEGGYWKKNRLSWKKIITVEARVYKDKIMFLILCW